MTDTLENEAGQPDDDPPKRVTWQTTLAAGKAYGGPARRPLVRILTLAWVPLTASFLSLILSVAAIFLSTPPP